MLTVVRVLAAAAAALTASKNSFRGQSSFISGSRLALHGQVILKVSGSGGTRLNGGAARVELHKDPLIGFLGVIGTGIAPQSIHSISEGHHVAVELEVVNSRYFHIFFKFRGQISARVQI